MIKEDERSIVKQKIESCESEIRRLEKAKKDAWDSIKDFRVSSNQADEVYKRMIIMNSQLKSMKTNKRKLEKKLNEIRTDSHTVTVRPRSNTIGQLDSPEGYQD